MALEGDEAAVWGYERVSGGPAMNGCRQGALGVMVHSKVGQEGDGAHNRANVIVLSNVRYRNRKAYTIGHGELCSSMGGPVESRVDDTRTNRLDCDEG